jgi:NhaP-type Na+/H+ and K+/H+ antiporter
MGYLVTCIIIGLITAPFCFFAMKAAERSDFRTNNAFKWAGLGFAFMAIGAVIVILAQPEHGVNFQAFVFRVCSAAVYFIIVVVSMVKGFGLI